MTQHNIKILSADVALRRLRAAFFQIYLKKNCYAATENLTREAFWNVYRPGCLEHYVLHCFRGKAGFVPELSLVMELDGKLIGHVMYIRSEIHADDGRSIPVMTFGPISIAPEYKRQGYGTILLRESMRRAKAMGVGALVIEGNIGFYGKSGFFAASTKGIHYAAEPRDAEVPYFLILELVPGPRRHHRHLSGPGCLFCGRGGGGAF